MFIKFNYIPEEITVVNFKIIFGVQIILEHVFNYKLMFRKKFVLFV